MPVSAVWSTPPTRLSITFTHPMQVAVPTDLGNWFVRHGGTKPAVTAVQSLVGVVVLSLGFGPPDPGPDVVSYSPPPFDLASNTAKPIAAPAFSAFPIT